MTAEKRPSVGRGLPGIVLLCGSGAVLMASSAALTILGSDVTCHLPHEGVILFYSIDFGLYSTGGILVIAGLRAAVRRSASETARAKRIAYLVFRIATYLFIAMAALAVYLCIVAIKHARE